MTKEYKNSLIAEVIENSQSKIWDTAVCEWEVIGCVEDRKQEQSCICGKENLKYLFEIRNKKNGQIIFPIGSKCIRKFEREDLNEDVDIFKQMVNLNEKLKRNEPIKINGECFSKKLLEYFYQEKVFKPSKYNGFNELNDYEFMVDMFNKRTKPTEKQQSKINGILYYNIKPYLQQKLKTKKKTRINQDDGISL